MGSKTLDYPLWQCFLPFAVSASLLLAGVGYGIGGGMSYYNEVALLGGAVVAFLLGWYRGVSIGELLGGIRCNLQPLLPTFVFVILISVVSVSWLLGGIIPSGVYLGIKYLPSSFFLVCVVVFCGFMGLTSGSSWLTVGTIGLAFLSIGEVLGYHKALVAGAIISGAYFGDKLTPLSETTVLAAYMTKTPLIRHVVYMLWTSMTTFVMTLLLFGLWQLMYPAQETGDAGELIDVLPGIVDIRAVWLLVPVVVLGLTMLRFSPYMTLGIGALLGYLIALNYQQDLLAKLAGDGGGCVSLYKGIKVLVYHTFWGFKVEYTGHKVVTNLFDRTENSGIWNMRGTFTIMLASLTLSGMMEGAGILDALMNRIGGVRSRGRLMVMTTLTAIFFNMTLADQYLAIMLTAKMFTRLFATQGLASENASRAIEDAATVTSPLVAWNTCGTAQAKALGVATGAYLPYCFYNLLSPVVSIAFMYLDIRIRRRGRGEGLSKK